MTEYRRVPTKVERLRIQAAEAAAIREALEDPNVVALMVERKRKFGEGLNWAAIGILAVFCIVTVHDFVSRGVGRYSLEWFGAWFLEPGLISGLTGILIWEGVTSRWGVPSGPWTRAAKWGLLGSTLTMNVWMSVATGSYGGIVAHTVPPLVIVLLTEARIESLLNLAECVRKAHAAAVQRKQALIAEQLRLAQEAAQAQEAAREGRLADAETDARVQVIRSEAGVTVATNAAAATAVRTGPTVFGQTGSDRPGIPPQTGPSDRSRPFPAVGPDRSESARQTGLKVVPGPASDRPDPQSQTGLNTPAGPVSDRSETRPRTGLERRPGPTRKTGPGRPGKPVGPRQQTDADLLPKVRELAAQNDGTPPTQYAIKQALGIGNDRAARLLKQLDPVPAGPPETNGAAKAGQH